MGRSAARPCHVNRGADPVDWQGAGPGDSNKESKSNPDRNGRFSVSGFLNERVICTAQIYPSTAADTMEELFREPFCAIGVLTRWKSVNTGKTGVSRQSGL